MGTLMCCSSNQPPIQPERRLTTNRPKLGMAAMYGGAALLVLLTLMSTCLPTGPPAREVTEAQLQLLTDSLDAIHLEVAAARRPTTWSFTLFLISILMPLAAAIWLVVCAQRSALDHDSGIRDLLQAGFTPAVVHSYLEATARPPQLSGPTLEQRHLPQRMSHRRRRRNRWRSRNRGNDPDESP